MVKIMRITHIVIFILLVTLSLDLYSQCPFGKVNCIGECGRFIDKNNDGYCDLGMVEKEKEKGSVSTQEVPQNQIENQTEVATHTSHRMPKTRSHPLKSDFTRKNEIAYTDTSDTIVSKICFDQPANPAIKNTEDESKEASASKTTKKPYHLLSISLITTILYFISTRFIHRKKIKKTTHRKIWNTLLLISFLISGLLGLFLIIQINYQVALSSATTFLFWHVEVGIVMVIIALIHAFWHIDYYWKMIKNQ